MSVKTVLLGAFGALVLVPTGTVVVGTPVRAAAPAQARADSSECRLVPDRWRERQTTFSVGQAGIRRGPDGDCRQLGQGWRGESVTTYCYYRNTNGQRWDYVRYRSLRGWTRSSNLVESSTTPCFRNPPPVDSDGDRTDAGNGRDDDRTNAGNGRDHGRQGGRNHRRHGGRGR